MPAVTTVQITMSEPPYFGRLPMPEPPLLWQATYA
jgi:hypothetical protein